MDLERKSYDFILYNLIDHLCISNDNLINCNRYIKYFFCMWLVSTIFFFEFACMLGGLLLQINLPGKCFNFVWGLGIHNCFQNRFVSELRAFPTHFPSILYFIFSKSHFFYFNYQFLQNTSHLILYFTIHHIKIL